MKVMDKAVLYACDGCLKQFRIRGDKQLRTALRKHRSCEGLYLHSLEPAFYFHGAPVYVESRKKIP